MKSRIRKLVAALSILLLGWLLWVGNSIRTFGNEDHARPADCAIVLGAAVYGDRPSPVFKERIQHAITLYQNGTVSRILFTGGTGDGAAHAESSVGAAFAVRAGVPAAAVLIEAKSRTTRGNLLEAKAVMATAGLRTAVIVSDPLHMKRAAMMAQDLGMTAATSPTPTSRYRSLKSKAGFLLREIYFHHHYQVFGN